MSNKKKVGALIDNLDKMIQQDPSLTNRTNPKKDNFAKPQLPRIPKDKRPHILVIDDDERAFLQPLEEQYQLSEYTDTFMLHTLHLTRTMDALIEIDQVLQKNTQIKVIFLDRGLDIGLPTINIIKYLRNNTTTRYFPLAVITKSGVQELGDDVDNLLNAGAQRVIFNKRSDIAFLYELYTSLEQLEESIQQQKWLDIWKLLNTKAREQAYIFDNQSEKEILRTVQNHLTDYMGHSYCLIREKSFDGTFKLLPSLDEYNSELPNNIDPKQVPLIRKLLDSKDNIAQRFDHLSAQQLGILKDTPLVGQHVLGCVMRHGNESFGTITLYRESDQAPFRHTDVTFMTSFAIDLGNLLGARRARQQLYEQQNDLLDFVSQVDSAIQEDDIIQLLIDRLHKEINQDKPAKTTLRLLNLATGVIQRHGQARGLPKKYNPMINLETEQATYTQAIREGKSLRSNDMNNDDRITFDNTLRGIQSCLVVPMMAGKLCLGAVNLESKQLGSYDQVDETYAASLCRAAAGALERLRAQSFQTQLLALFRSLPNTNDDPIAKIYKITTDYFGVARLLRLQKTAIEQAPWQITQLIGPVGQLFLEKKRIGWQTFLDKTWSKTNIKRILDRPKPRPDFIIEQRVEIPQFEQDIIIRSMAVIPLYKLPDAAPDSALVLFFRVEQAINENHLKVLNLLGDFLNAVRHHQEKVRGYLVNAMLNSNLAESGEAAQQNRHSSVNQLGAIRNLVDNLQVGLDTQDEFLAKIQTPLDTLKKSLGRNQYWSKIPALIDCDARQVWQDQAKEFVIHAQAKGIIIDVTGSAIPLHTDPDILGVVFFNLIQNALDACPAGSRIWLVQLPDESGNTVLMISDDGPGITSSVRETLFQMGITTKSSGSGFGLYFTRSRMHDLAGDILLQKTTTGACFRLILPSHSR